MSDEREESDKTYRRMHIRIKPGQTLTDDEGVTYVNQSKVNAARITVVRGNKPNTKEVSVDAADSRSNKE